MSDEARARRSILLTGGARSGKSRTGLALAKRLTERPVYVATSRRVDEEHGARIDRHRAERGPEWTTIEEPLEPSRAAPSHSVLLVDCVTLWLYNVFEREREDLDRSLAFAREEVERCFEREATWIWVTNELGSGLHGSTPSTRRFVDLQGFMNQWLAARSEAVALLVAGLPLVLKGTLP